MEPIKIYIGISHKFDCIKNMTANSIRENSSVPVDIELLYPEVESGCTGFSNVRYTIRQGIYLDCDMIVFDDIAKLWGYHEVGKFVCLQDGSTEVAVIDCIHKVRNKMSEQLLPKSCTIPLSWNVEDYKYFETKELPSAMSLFHMTALPNQPWFYENPLPEAKKYYERYNY